MKKPSLVMMRESPCSTKIREGLKNPSPPPSRFPLAMGFAPLDPRDFPRVSGCKTHSRGKSLKISLDPRNFPRASPSGNLLGLGKSFGRRGWISQYLPRLGGARIQSVSVDFLLIAFCVTVNVKHAVSQSPYPSYHLSKISWFLQLDRVVQIGRNMFPPIK